MNTRSMVALGIFAVGVALVAPYAINEANERMALTDRASGLETDLARIQHEQQLLDTYSQLAEARYQEGCALLYKDGVFVTLTEGAIVVDRLTNERVVDGMTVCDTDGNTGTTQGGLIINTAWTGNQEVVQDAIDRANEIRRFVGVQEASASE